MTSILDSEAHLTNRMQEVGMSANGQRSMMLSGLNTLGKLAFSHGQPGVAIVEEAFVQFAQNTLGAMMTLGDQASLKRLLFEAHTQSLSMLKESITNPDAAQTRRLPPVERQAKMERLKAQLPGVIIEHQLEPAFALLDSVSQQWETRQLVYLDPSKCQSREFEIAMGKTSKQIHIDSDKLTVKEQQAVPSQQGMSELQTLDALKRRGLAYAFADVISWSCHERYLSKLYSHLHRDPPATFAKPTLQQILKADRAVFTKLIQAGVSVRRDPVTNVLPLDAALEATLSDYDVAFNLMPLPKVSAPPSVPKSDHIRPRMHKAQPYGGKGGKGKSKGKGSGGKSRGPLPRIFWGRDCVACDPHNRRLCFDYSLGKCTKAVDGGECENVTTCA